MRAKECSNATWVVDRAQAINDYLKVMSLLGHM